MEAQRAAGREATRRWYAQAVAGIKGALAGEAPSAPPQAASVADREARKAAALAIVQRRTRDHQAEVVRSYEDPRLRLPRREGAEVEAAKIARSPVHVERPPDHLLQEFEDGHRHVDRERRERDKWVMP